jgi:hypothetical protein
MIIQKSKNGFQFWGREGGKIGPAAAFADVAIQPDLIGTVSAGSAGPPIVKSSTLTGVSTTFLSDLKPGDYIELLVSPNPILAMVGAIATDTSLTLKDPNNPSENLEVYIPALTNYRKFNGLWLGKTAPDGINVSIDESTVETKSSDRGESAENVYSSGTSGKIELTLMEPSLESLNKLLKGMVNVTRDSNGLIVASSIGSRTGYDFKRNAIQLAIIEYDGTQISADPQDRLDCFKVAFSGVFSTTKNSTDQQGVTLTGHIFEDDTRRVNGIPQYMATNLPAMVFDA